MDSASYAKSLHDQNPSWTAMQVGTQVLAQFPQMDSNEMIGALTYAGFSFDDAQAATEQLFGHSEEVVVVAASKWQNTRIMIEGNQAATVSYVSGQWTANPSTGMVDAAGNPSYIAKSGYTMEGQHEGALIGLIGQDGVKEGEVKTSYQPFLVGNNGTVPLGQKGYLFLCINDDLYQRYGAGFTDNEGQVIVKIVEAKAGVSS